ncbi:unnamed protein product [Echinostoma caproni]|uniref:Uncharacterized protein n=1 Tax=Echinostoma caproni TaxID=27848 RepID=A0A3P8HVM9_9TREM|nr:unnamed protein product [Echinostoma caproni]
MLPPKQETPVAFSGSNQSDVPADRLLVKRHRLDNVPFTLTFWMRHGPHSPPAHPVTQDEANGREHIVCISDEEEKNRHHFAVYVHNCKLTMLLRREPVNSRNHERVRLYPSQWRFSVDDVCDNLWHHYALSFRPPPAEVVQGSVDETSDWTVETQVKLLIDGDPVPFDANLVQITEDVPMHELRHHSTRTRLTVGACWHSRIARHVQHFTGELAAMMLSIGAEMPNEQVQCLANCYPRLHVTGPLNNAQLPDLPPLHQSRLDNLIVQANHLTDLTDLMQHVIFFNPRIKRLPTQRPEPVAIRLSTSVKYPSECQAADIPVSTIHLVRLPLTKTVESSIWAPPQTSRSDQRLGDLKSTGQLVSSTGRVVPMHSLILRTSQSLSEPLTISSSALIQGVWLFPSVELSWLSLAKPNNAEMVEMNDAVSHCDVDLCPAESIDKEPLEFARQETITVGTDFLAPGIRIEQSTNGMRFRGPVRADEITQTLQHLKWFNLEHEPPEKRCFRLICVAQADTHSGPQLLVQSNILKVVGSQKVDEPAVLLKRDPLLMPVKTSADDSVPQLSEPNMNDPSWTKSMHVTYTLMGCAIAIVLISIAVGMTYFFRARRANGPTVPNAKKNHRWEPVPTLKGPVSFQVPSTIPARSSIIGERSVGPRNATLEVIINPTTHRKEFEEMEKKFCFYDRKMYDEDDEDALDPDNPAFQDTIYDSEQARVYRSYEAGDDPHEDVSDFDVTSDREAQTGTPTTDTVPDSTNKSPVA